MSGLFLKGNRRGRNAASPGEKPGKSKGQKPKGDSFTGGGKKKSAETKEKREIL